MPTFWRHRLEALDISSSRDIELVQMWNGVNCVSNAYEGMRVDVPWTRFELIEGAVKALTWNTVCHLLITSNRTSAAWADFGPFSISRFYLPYLREIEKMLLGGVLNNDGFLSLVGWRLLL